MRVSTNMIYQQALRNMTQAESSLLVYGNQLATGKRVVKPSDDPQAAALAVMIAQTEAQNSQYRANLSFADNAMSLEDSTLTAVVSAIKMIKDLLVHAGDGAIGDLAAVALGTQMRALKADLLQLANSMDGDRSYIFAGYQTATKPFEINAGTGEVSYVGGKLPITQQVDENRRVIISHTGHRIFMTLPDNPIKEPADPVTGLIPPSEADIFKSIDIAIRALEEPWTTEAIKHNAVLQFAKASRGISNSLTNVLTVHTQLGSEWRELSDVNTLSSSRMINNVKQISTLVDADMYEATSNYHQQKVTLEAAMAVVNSMKGLSLFQINR